jgi:hypothetical protein
VTLVELLMVVAVIVLLAGLMLPLVSLAKAIAQRTACAGHLRQVGMATLLYAGEHGGVAPGSRAWGVSDPARSIAWYHRLPPYHGLREVGAAGIFQCPSYHWGGPRGHSALGREPPKSYKMNAAIDSERGRYEPFALGACRDADRLVLFLDADTGTGMGQWGHAPVSAVDATRHGGAVNVLCADGRLVRLVDAPADHRWDTALTWRSRDWEIR